MPPKKSSKENAIIVLVVVVVLVGFAWWSMSKSPAPAGVSVNNGATVPTEDTSVGSVNAGSPAASISYTDALVTYKNARLQLDSICQGSPDKMTFKNNALLMVDNRAPVARTVHIGSVFGIKAYGFKIVRLSSATLPATWKVDCDSSQNVSTILIEK